MRQFFYFLFVACMLIFGSCNTDNDMIESEIYDDGYTLHTIQMVLDGSKEHFDAPTRAAISEWDDSAKLFIKFATASGNVDGIATYSILTDSWEVQYYGSIIKGKTSSCEVFFFDNPQSTTMTSIMLLVQSAVFSDNQASYLFENGVVKLMAHLKPLTGRLRFRGSVGQKISFSGLKWYHRYDISSNTFSIKTTDMTVLVDSDGYTPYVYAAFANDSLPQLKVFSDEEDYAFLKSFDSSVLANGKSGYLDIPTIENRNGWLLEDYTQQDFSVIANGKTVTFKMIKVKPGTFQMGRPDGITTFVPAGGVDDERPVHSVTLPQAYYMGETEVTQALWYAVMGQNPTTGGSSWSSSYGLGDNYPAYDISYEDCQQFLTKLNQLTGQQFRFPTEAEWEFAARGGNKSKGYDYAGSNTIDDVGWYYDNSGDKTHEVAEKKANELGLYDMCGNVREWCYDWYGIYSSYAQTNPKGPSSGSKRVIRGGCYSWRWLNCRVFSRYFCEPSWGSSITGFRLAL